MRKGNYTATEYLCEVNKKLMKLKNNSGQTVLDLAAEMGSETLVDLFKRMGLEE